MDIEWISAVSIVISATSRISSFLTIYPWKACPHSWVMTSTSPLVPLKLAKINGDIYISGRSSSDINVQVILEELGGGGHMNMAGAKVPGIPIETVIMKLKESIKKHLRVGE